MLGRKHPREHALESAEKENHPPKKTKRMVSIAGLYGQGRHVRHNPANAGRNVLAPNPVGVTKPSAKKSIFAQFAASKKPERHPLCRDFTEATTAYRESSAALKSQQLEPICDALIARVHGLDIDGEPANDTSTLSNAQLEDFIRVEKAFSKPLHDEMMPIESRPGSGLRKATEVKYGDTVAMFGKLFEKKRPELEELLHELHEVDKEIAAAYKDICLTEKREGGKLRRELDIELENLLQEARQARDETLMDVEQAQKVEQDAAKAERRKAEELLS